MPTKSKKAPAKKSTTKQINPDNYTVEALAGCGKTSQCEWNETGVPKGITLSEQQEAIFNALKRPKSKKSNYKVRFCCFNNSIKNEAEERFKKSGIPVDVRTNHQVGL